MIILGRKKVLAGLGLLVLGIALAFSSIHREGFAQFWDQASFRVFNLTASSTTTTTLAVGGGTSQAAVYHGSVTVDSAGTTNTLTLTGVTATDRVLATITSGNSSGVFIATAIPATDEVRITLSGTPGSDADVDVLVIR